MAKQISATEASRRFSRMLDDVEHHGTEYVVERQGRPVAKVVPAARTGGGITWGEFLRRRRAGPQFDPDFAREMRWIRSQQGDLPKDPWVRSSTRRS